MPAPPRPPRLARARSSLLACALAACAAAPVGCATAPQSRPGSTRYADEAQSRYEQALQLYQSESWPEATEAFRAVRQSYAVSQYAALADLRLADIDFKQERYTEALSGFRAWLRYHPTHAEATYARFMIARCHYAQMPEDWLLVPASWERDQSSVHDAMTSLERYVRDHPESPHAPEARRMLRHTRELLARHEIYVANFYASRDRHNAAVSRLLGVLRNFQDSGLESQALLQLGEIYLRTNRRGEARGAFDRLLEAYPESAEVRAARAYIERLGDTPSVPLDLEEAGPVIPPPADRGTDRETRATQRR